MSYYYINTDWDAREDAITCDLWFEHKMAFAGDYDDNKWNHTNLFRKLEVGDILFMYHSLKDRKHHKQKGYVGIGVVTSKWDEKCYEKSHRLLYKKELYEYRIDVSWSVDWRLNPKQATELGLPVSPNYWCTLDDNKYGVTKMIQKLGLNIL